MRFLAAFLLLQFTAVLITPALIVADFMVERDHIVRELCVQRMVPEAQRSCHGDCCLKKRLDESGARERNMPTELRALRIGDMIADEGMLPPTLVSSGVKRTWGILVEEPLAGHHGPGAPVPWC
jgi:hypothetical protein